MNDLVGVDRFANMELTCDIDGKTQTSNINNMNTMIRETGRATFVEDGIPYFQVIECEEDELRNWDVDEEGPVCNPVGA